MIRAAELIERKRDGGELRADELRELVLGYGRGEIPDYQLAAFCMAVFFRGLSAAETFALTEALIASGTTVDLSGELGRKVVDKHSTGGVGDKTSLAVGPIVAACGVPFGKMSGRGLGHTGGPLDKLESISGFRVELTVDEFIDSVALIASSIMSKKIAAGAGAIVLDVKVGDGAFMKTLDDARTLADAMLELGRRAGRQVVSVLTDMDQPLGHAVGNALEIRETIATLRGDGPPDFNELVLAASAHLLALSDLGIDEASGRERAAAAVQDGSALAAYERWIRAQGGDPDEEALPTASVVRTAAAPADGYVRRLGAVDIGMAALHLGAGRSTKADVIDHAVGVRCLKKRGDAVATGEPLSEIHAQDEPSAERAVAEVLAAYTIGAEAPPSRPIVLETIA